MNLQGLLLAGVEMSASDMFLIAGSPPSFRKDSTVVQYGDVTLGVGDVEQLVHEIYNYAKDRPIDRLLAEGDDDFSFSVPGIGRFRANTFRQRGSLAAVIRIVMFTLPNPDELGIPKTVMDLTEASKGLILVTGQACSGKSTTLACMVDKINNERHDHILTMEEPLEFIHLPQKRIVTQRGVSGHTNGDVW